MVKCSVLFEVRTEFFKYYLDELRLQRINAWFGVQQDSEVDISVSLRGRAQKHSIIPPNTDPANRTVHL
jgi:hypothetical protein